MATYEVGYKPSFGTNSIAQTSATYSPKKIDFSANGSTIPAAHLVQPGHKIVGFYVGGRAVTAGTLANASCSAYVTNSTAATAGARVSNPTITASTTSATTQWHYSGAINIDLSAFVGQWIKPAVSGPNFRLALVSGGVSGDYQLSNNTFPDPFGSATNSASLIPLYMVIADGEKIDSINSGSPVTYGQPSTWATTGFDPAPNAGTLDSVAMTSVSASGFGAFNLIDGATVPRIGTRTATATNGTQSASSPTVVDVPATMNLVQLVDPLDTSEYSALPAGAAAGGWMLWFNTINDQPTNTFIHSDGAWETSVSGSQTVWYMSPTGVLSEGTLLTGGTVTSPPTMPTTVTTTVTAGATVLGTYAATAGTAPITYTLGGTNASLFAINGETGLVTFLAPAVVGAGSITVTATNSSGSATTTVNYTVNAAPETTPGDGGHLLSGKTLRGTFIKGQTLKGKYL